MPLSTQRTEVRRRAKDRQLFVVHHILYIITYTHTSVTVIRFRPPGYFAHVSITTPVVSALKNYYI